MQRISIIGTSGSGKTTLARQLSQRLNIPHIELDALHWGPNWTPVPKEVFQTRFREVLGTDNWVMCGNYSSVTDKSPSYADTIIWLDYPMSLVLRQMLRRTFQRCWTREILWNGNRERFFTTLFTRESILFWVWTTWRRRRRDYPKMLKYQASLGKRVLRFRTPKQTREWFQMTSHKSPSRF